MESEASDGDSILELSSRFSLLLNDWKCPVTAWSVAIELYALFCQGSLLWSDLKRSMIPLESSCFFETNHAKLKNLIDNSLTGKKAVDFNLILNLNDRSVQALLREININDLIIVLNDCRPEIKDKFLNNMSKRAREMMIEDLNVDRSIYDQQSKQAQQDILIILKKMMQSGEIGFIE